MRLLKIQDYMKRNNMPFDYFEEDGCGSIDFTHRGLVYHIWEYHEGTYGAESNVRTCGRSEDFEGDYENAIIDILKTW